jgi:hypothetical protein
MGGFDFFGAVSIVLLFSGCIALHLRLRNRASTCLLASIGFSLLWAWLDSRIPYWSLGPSPIPEALLTILFKSAFLMPTILTFAFAFAFLATALSVPKRLNDPGSGV